MLILAAHEVYELLTPRECADVMREALTALARGQVHQPLRTVVRPPDAKGAMALMPSYRFGEGAAYGLKVVCVFPGNPALGKDAHQGGVLLLSAETGELVALMNASAITEIRTAAVSAVATDLLARADSRELAIIGAGVQARSHLLALAGVRPLERVRIAGRDPARAERLAADLQGQVDAAVAAVGSAEEAVRGADIVVTATSSSQPVLARDWLSPGTHINAVGSSIPAARELDTATVAAASLFVDRRESTLNEAGDYLFPLREGAIGPDHIRAEIGEILIGTAAGRTRDDEITLFKSLGLAVEDLAVAVFLHDKATRLGAGVDVRYS